MIILQYHEVFFRLAEPTAMPAHLGAYSLKKTSWYRNIIILLGVEEHPNYAFWQGRETFNHFMGEDTNYTNDKSIFGRVLYMISILNFFPCNILIWVQKWNWKIRASLKKLGNHAVIAWPWPTPRHNAIL